MDSEDPEFPNPKDYGGRIDAKIALPAQIRIINPADLAHTSVPARQWITEDWLPIGCVTANYGDGGVGKTLLAHQLMTATALGVPWCGREVMQCRSLALFCEDDEAELHRRQAAICAAYGASMADLEPLRWISGVGEDCAIMTFAQDGGACTTPLYDAIKQAALDHGARLVVLDTAADLFAGNENDRHQVRRFIGQLNRLAIDLNGAVLLNAHPSRSGLASGNLDGGSTAWSNSVRSRWSLARPVADDHAEPDNNARILTRRKANYAAIGDDIRLQWTDGVLLPPSSPRSAGAPERAAAAEMFLVLMDRCVEQGQSVSHSPNAPNYAPKAFGKRPDRQGYTRRDFEVAIQHLFAMKRIRVEEYGRPGKWRNRIVRER
ncbi:MAG: AAA family ATPase [Pseudomonadota bacterium]|nr:AAA family ATPase [Pseudomonadota bacterium]